MICRYCRQEHEGAGCYCLMCQDLHLRKWNEILPSTSEYRKTVMSRLEIQFPACLSQYNEILHWTPDHDHGLTVWGPPRLGKTRTCWLLLRRLFDLGSTIRALRSNEFANQLGESYGSGMGPAWVREASSYDVLFIDDIDKMVMTKRVQSEFFGVIETITSGGRKLIVTMNSCGNEFEKNFDDSIAGAIMGRLREFNDSVFVGPATEGPVA